MVRTKGERSARARQGLSETTEQERNEHNRLLQTCTGMRLKPRFRHRTTRPRCAHPATTAHQTPRREA
jgi:hypothetical protein